MAQDGVDELWQAYNDQGEPTIGVGLTKRAAGEGALHGAVHVWLWRRSGKELEIAVQQRSDRVRTWPHFWDATVGGHIDLGESPLATAVREAKEEIGLAVVASDLKLLFVHHLWVREQPSNIIENEFQWVYGFEVFGDTSFRHHDSEAGNVRWFKLAEFKQLVKGQLPSAKLPSAKLLPQGEEYFFALITAIERSL